MSFSGAPRSISRADKLFREYGASHQNKVNKLIHWVCVPAILVSVVGALECLPFPVATPISMSWGKLVAALAMMFYINLSASLSVGMFLVLFASFWIVSAATVAGYTWKLYAVVFGIAWVFQFIGHSSLFEGKKPSFFKDLFFLLIGPAWLVHFIYKLLGIPY